MKFTLLIKTVYVVFCVFLVTGWSDYGWTAEVPATETAEQTEESTVMEDITVVAKRENRVSSGATKLPLEIKETPQTISIIDQDTLTDFGVTGSNDALWLGTGINIDQYETNRTTYNARGFEIQLTQIDGLGMTNSFGTVIGQLDTYMFDKIELIRGANGLLTGVGNPSGTINYVRKRPENEDGGEIRVTGGSHDFMRVEADYNKVLTQDGRWAARMVVAHEDADSYLRALHNRRTTVYGVVDGQIGDNGILTMGVTVRDDQQDSPMWGSLTLNYADGSMADFDQSSSTSVDWTYWDTRSYNAFIEYAHSLNSDWEAKVTYNYRNATDDTRLLYAYSFTNTLNDDNTGLYGWPYSSHTVTENHLLDVNISGYFQAFGREHNLIAGVSYSHETVDTDVYDYDSGTYLNLPLPAFPYLGNAYPEPQWYSAEPRTSSEQALTRVYAASRLSITGRLKFIAGLNAIRLEREGSSRYGSVVTNENTPDTQELSPYAGVTFDFTDNILGYVSYSDIFLNQDQTDFDGHYLDPTKGVNIEAGIKAEWFDQKLLTTLALFQVEQQGLATYAGLNDEGEYYYVPVDVESKGFEIEITGRIGEHAKLVVGLTHLEITDPNGDDIYEWVPRTTINALFSTRMPMLPKLKMGVSGRWQSDTKGDYARQDAYMVANAFASYDLTEETTVRVNVKNIFDEKYVGGLAYGAIYGEPTSVLVSLDYKF